MLKFLKNSFRRTNDCIILITPLVIFISIFNLYFNYLKVSVNDIPKLILAVLTCWIMLGGLLSGWFYMLKKTLVLSDKLFLFDNDRGKELAKIIVSFPKGIGSLSQVSPAMIFRKYPNPSPSSFFSSSLKVLYFLMSA